MFPFANIINIIIVVLYSSKFHFVFFVENHELTVRNYHRARVVFVGKSPVNFLPLGLLYPGIEFERNLPCGEVIFSRHTTFQMFTSFKSVDGLRLTAFNNDVDATGSYCGFHVSRLQVI